MENRLVKSIKWFFRKPSTEVKPKCYSRHIKSSLNLGDSRGLQNRSGSMVGLLKESLKTMFSKLSG
jgi:hypothetical protein